MKKSLILALGLFCAVGANAQKILAVQSFPSLDTAVSIPEGFIWKIDNQTGDSTSVISYAKWNGDETTIVCDTNEAEILTRTSRLITPTGLGYTINADRVMSAFRLTDSTSFIFYQRGSGAIIQIPLNSLSVTEFNAVVNGL